MSQNICSNESDAALDGSGFPKRRHRSHLSPKNWSSQQNIQGHQSCDISRTRLGKLSVKQQATRL